MEEINEKTEEIKAEDIESDPPFFDVLPKNQIKSSIINAKVKIEPEKSNKPLEQTNKIMRIFKSHKAIFIFIIVILVLAYPTYFIITKYIVKPIESENLLINPASEVKSEIETENKNLTQTPEEWQNRYFGTNKCLQIELCGDEADADRDGLNNLNEYKVNTDPNNTDSDQDGIADGDEINIFSSDPTKTSTLGDENYNDGQYLKGGYNVLKKDILYTKEQILEINTKIKATGIHKPTYQTLGESLLNIYNFSVPIENQTENNTTTTTTINPLDGVEQTAEARQDRDTQRSTTIKNIAIALIKYNETKKTYPETSDFSQMYGEIKIFTRVAINPIDPINKDKYIYTYTKEKDKDDFILSFFSESQNQIIKTRSQDGKKYLTQNESAILDDQRKTSMENLRSALLLYSSQNVSGNSEYVFPTKEQLATSLVPKLISEIPKDPKNNEPFEYQVSEDFESFTLKTLLDAPPVGKTGYLCNQEECRIY